MKIFKSILLFLLLVFLFPSAILADSIQLISGEVIEGQVVHQTDIFVRIIPMGKDGFTEYLLDRIANVTKNGATTTYHEVVMKEAEKAGYESLKPIVKDIVAEENVNNPAAPVEQEEIPIVETVAASEDEVIRLTAEPSEQETEDEQTVVELVEESEDVIAAAQENTIKPIVKTMGQELQEEVDSTTALLPQPEPKEKKPAELLTLVETPATEPPQWYEQVLFGAFKVLHAVIGVIIIFLVVLLVINNQQKQPIKDAQEADTNVQRPGGQQPAGTLPIPPHVQRPGQPLPANLNKFPPGYTARPSMPPAEGSPAQPTAAQPMPGEITSNVAEQINSHYDGINPKNYWMYVGGIFAYPLRRNIFFATVGGTIFFTIINFTVWVPFYGFIISLMFGCYLIGCLVSIVNVAATKERDDVFEWPEFINWSDWFGTTILFILANIISALPAFLYLKYISHFSFDFVFFALVLMAVYIYPMFILTISLVGGFQSLNIFGVFIAIKQVFIPYTFTVLFFMFLQVLSAIVAYKVPLTGIPFWGNFFKWFISIYFMFITYRLLGIFYRAHRLKLNWFGEEA